MANLCKETYAGLALHHEQRTCDSHAERIEAAHRRLFESVRPALIHAGLPRNFWEDCAIWATDVRNVRAVQWKIPHIELLHPVSNSIFSS